MTIAVFGAAGQLGSELCRQLGSQATPLDLPDCDITNRAAVGSVLERLGPTAVINAAAYTQVDRAEDEPDACFAANATAVAHLADACSQMDLPLVQFSTDYVFSGPQGRTDPFEETESPSPRGVYATSKSVGEENARVWRKHFILRTCGLYARPNPQRSPQNFVETMLRLSGETNVVRVVMDQHCTPSYVPHVARATIFLLKTQHYGTYHVTNGGATTWHEFGEEVFRLGNRPTRAEPITTDEYGPVAPRPAYSVLDCHKYLRLGGPPLPHWKAALAEYFQERREETG